MALEQLYIARDAMEAHLLKAMLEDRGIAAAVMGEMLGAARGELPLTPETLPSVWVDRRDTPEAVEVVRELITGRDEYWPDEEPTPDPWACPYCGADVDGQFGACWHCTEPKPDWL